VDVIVDREFIEDAWITDNCGVYTPEYLITNSELYERVIYHFGNSYFHSYMYALLERVPGVVVLHNFYLGDLAYHMHIHEGRAFGLNERFISLVAIGQSLKVLITQMIYLLRFDVFEKSKSVVVHSAFAKMLARKYYSNIESSACHVIPLLRQPAYLADKTEVRKSLGLKSGDFVVCSFGFIGRNKLNIRLI
jgi:hypothetical protein